MEMEWFKPKFFHEKKKHFSMQFSNKKLSIRPLTLHLFAMHSICFQINLINASDIRFSTCYTFISFFALYSFAGLTFQV